MPSIRSRRTQSEPQRIAFLENGERLDQKTFHERYEAAPSGFHAELIEGVVYMPSPQKLPHGRHQKLVLEWLTAYERATPGTEVIPTPTTILGPESEPEPNVCLILDARHGGQTWEDENHYLNGPPELIVEIAWSTGSIDLHAKKRDYEKAGVREYVVVALRQESIVWFMRRRGRFKEQVAGTDGFLRSEVFPGLCLDPAALLALDWRKVAAVQKRGLASAEHAAFVAKLAGR